MDAYIVGYDGRGASGLTADFEAFAGGGEPPYSFAWSFGATSQSASYTFPAPGRYDVGLYAADCDGESDGAGIQLTVIQGYQPFIVEPPAISGVRGSAALPAAAGPGASLSGTAPFTVTLSDNATGGASPGNYTFSWTFGDGGSATASTVTHTYLRPGLYHINVNATDSQGNIANNSIWVNVTATPVPLYALASSTTAGTSAPLLVNFSSGGTTGGTPPYSYHWNFGDGAISTLASPSHVYDHPGNYSAWLYVEDSQGNTASSGLVVDVPTPPLVANASVSATSGLAPLTVAFSGMAHGGVGPPYYYNWTFGDGGTSTLQAPNYTYYSSTLGPYNATLTVTDAAGQSASASVRINVSGAIEVRAAASLSSGTGPLSTDFSADAAGGTPPYTYAWSFGDGAFGIGPTPQHTYLVPGSYIATVIVTDQAGRSAIAGVSVTVRTSPMFLRASGDPTNGSAPLTTSFSESVQGGVAPYAYTWSFGSGATSSSESPTYTYTHPGTYVATVTVTDAAGDTQRAAVTILVGPATATLSALASALPSLANASQAVSFLSGATGGTPPYSFTWNFGDGGTGSGPAPNHVYSIPGSYLTQLTVTDAAGHTATTLVSVRVIAPSVDPYEPNISLQAIAAFGPSFPENPLAVQFSGSAMGGTPPYQYAWSFGDGDTALGTSPEHSYTSPGSYVAVLTVTDARGTTNVTAMTVYLNGTVSPGISALQAYVRATPAHGYYLQSVTFNGSAAGGTGPYTYNWSYGDGSASTVANGTHYYGNPGRYTVILTVRDSMGREAQATAFVNIATGPEYYTQGALAVASADVGVVPFNVSFVGSSLAGLPPYVGSWTFGDGGYSSGLVASHQYTTPGIYTITFVTNDSSGYYYPTYFDLTIVAEAPSSELRAVALASTVLGPAPLTSIFAAVVFGGSGPYQYAWNLGDGTTESGPSATGTFLTAGQYLVNLTITDANGATTSTTVAVTVTPPSSPLSILALPSLSRGISPLAVGFSSILSADTTGGLAYTWSLPNGTVFSDASRASYSFTGIGTVEVALRVANLSMGAGATYRLSISLPPAFLITFEETGLAPGTSWSVLLNGQPLNATSNTASFAELNGTYTYAIEPIRGYTVSPSSGTVIVQGRGVQVPLVFTAFEYIVTFGQRGLPSGIMWNITLDGSAQSSTGNSIEFSVPNGTYSYTVGSVPGYTPSPSSGSVTVNGAAVDVPTITWTQVIYTVTFAESGLPTGTNWTVAVAGTTVSSTTGRITLQEPNGTYGYVITPIAGYSTTYRGQVTVDGNNPTVAVMFTAVTYALTFTETGLPSGASWSVTLAGTVQTSTTTTITFQEPNGTYAFSVGSVSSYSVAPSTGSPHISGAPVTQALTFSTTSSSTSSAGFLGLSGNTGYYVLIGIAIVAIAGAAGAFFVRTRRR